MAGQCGAIRQRPQEVVFHGCSKRGLSLMLGVFEKAAL
jgi:hypothetical protein